MAAFSSRLEETLRRALANANGNKHIYVTLEHLLFTLLSDEDALEVFSACRVDVPKLRSVVADYISAELGSLKPKPGERPSEARPTAGFQRSLQRAMLHVDSAGRRQINGADVLVALFSERESHAAYFLHEADISRLDAVGFIASKHAGDEQASPPKLKIDANKITLNVIGAELSRQMAETETVRARNAELERQLMVARERIAELEEAISKASIEGGRGISRAPDIFVSYRQSDREKVRAIVEQLRIDGFLVWWDVDIPAGSPWEKTIEEKAGQAKIVLVCWSADSVGSESVKAEARFGRDRNRLVQLFIDGTKAPMFFGEHQGLKFSDWNGNREGECYVALVRSIREQM